MRAIGANTLRLEDRTKPLGIKKGGPYRQQRKGDQDDATDAMSPHLASNGCIVSASDGFNAGEPRDDGHRDERHKPIGWMGRFARRLCLHHAHAPHWVIAILTLALALFACFAWIESMRTTAAIQGQLTEARNATVVSNRAWLGAGFMQLTAPIENGKPVDFQIRMQNTGRTPALNVVYRFNEFTMPYILISWIAVGLMLMPNRECPIRRAMVSFLDIILASSSRREIAISGCHIHLAILNKIGEMQLMLRLRPDRSLSKAALPILPWEKYTPMHSGFF